MENKSNKANKAQDKANKAQDAAPVVRIDRATLTANGRQPNPAAALAALVAFVGPDGAVTPADVAVVTGKAGKAVRHAIRYVVPAKEGSPAPLGKLEDLGLSVWSFPVTGKYLARLLAHLFASGGGRTGGAAPIGANLAD